MSGDIAALVPEHIERILQGGLPGTLEALACDCENTDGWEDAAPGLRRAATTITDLQARLEAAEAENAKLREALLASTEWLESVLAAMDKYNEANGTYIIGPSLLGCGRQVAANRATLGGEHG